MAKIKWSMAISAVSGKLNGSVFARNRGGSYVRNKTTPSNPQSTAQIAVRARLSGFSAQWKTLTQALRDAWSGASVNFAKSDVFGDPVIPTGSNLFTRVNSNIANAGGTVITAPPALIGVFQPLEATLTVDAVTPEVTIDLDSTGIDANSVFIVEATAPMSAGIANANNKYRQIGTLPSATVFPYDATAMYEAKFGAPVVGKKVFARIKCINKVSGEVSQTVKSDAIGA